MAKKTQSVEAPTREATTRRTPVTRTTDTEVAGAVAGEASAVATRQDLEEAARILKSKNSKKRERRKAAGVLSVVGASKGGTNRARNLTDAQRSDIARMGGLARQAQARERKSGELQTKPARLEKSLDPRA